MNIFHLNLQDGWRGGEQQLAYLLLNHKSRGISQTLACKENSTLHKFALENKIPCITVNTKGLYQIKAIFKVFRFLKKTSQQLIHCHESRGLNIILALKILFSIKQPLILHRRVVFPIKGWFSKHIKYSSKYIDKTICISTAVEKVLTEATKNTNTIVIPSMTDISFNYVNQNILKENYGIDTSKTIIGYIAALTFEKDHITFLQTAALILKTKPEVQFVIIGSGKLEKELKELSKQLNIDHNIHFLGYIENAKALIPEIDLLLFTSQLEGFGSTILDFFIAKKPVVTVDNGGSRDAVINGVTGFICPPKDVHTLAKNTLKLLNSEELTNQIVSNAYDLVLNKFSTEKVCTDIYNVYTQTINNLK